MPVSHTSALALPAATEVPIYTILERSARGVSFSSKETSVLATGVDSPVRLASWVEKLAVRHTIRLSAGTLSPASNVITSPGTNSWEEITLCWPSLITFEAGEDNFFNAASDFSARYS